MTSNAEIAQRGQKVLVGNYAPQPISLVRGEGCWLFDAEDRRYLDLMGGIATAALGHANPKLRRALDDQAAKLWHVSNLFTTEPQIRLAERLTATSFAESVYFCNSGAEANEAALKLARRHHRDQGRDRFEIIAFEGGFHGRTLFTVTATGTPALIDPAVYYGHREADLAMTELFGGFQDRFYDAYRAARPLEPGYETRRDVYNLYHLINHLNLFGAGYAGSVEEILRPFG